MGRALVFVNSTVYGGGGGGPDGVAVASLYDPDWTGPHELGHAAFGLADEYCYDAGSYTGSEPVEPSVTAVNTLTGLKWASSVDPATPIPTTTNPDLTCLTCDTQASRVAVGTVGLFEGAKSVACGCYRPEYNCLVRTFYVGFCTVCTDRVAGRLTLGSLLDLTPCLVATSVYGDPQHPDVMTLRRWRDRHLQPGAVAHLPCGSWSKATYGGTWEIATTQALFMAFSPV